MKKSGGAKEWGRARLSRRGQVIDQAGAARRLHHHKAYHQLNAQRHTVQYRMRFKAWESRDIVTKDPAVVSAPWLCGRTPRPAPQRERAYQQAKHAQKSLAPSIGANNPSNGAKNAARLA